MANGGTNEWINLIFGYRIQKNIFTISLISLDDWNAEYIYMVAKQLLISQICMYPKLLIRIFFDKLKYF